MNHSEHNQQRSPFMVHLERDGNGRISKKTEHVAGGRTRELRYTYTPHGLLQIVEINGARVEMYQYDNQNRRERSWVNEPMPEERGYHYHGDRFAGEGASSMQHDEHGFRAMLEHHGGDTERYEYAPDYRLLRVEKGSDLVEYEHDPNGQRTAKWVNGILSERYKWLDFIRLDQAMVHGAQMRFHYAANERLPYAMTRNGTNYGLHYDQVGSLRVVADVNGNVISEVMYDSFGNIIEQTNPSFIVPLGFAGGLHDQDTNWVRFGWRDYDPRTGRFTAPDPIGLAGGDEDVYGYCLDDPVNGVDPEGLMGRKPDNAPSQHKESEFRNPDHGKYYWTVTPKLGACDKCQAMKGIRYPEEPERPHPNCKCKIERHEVARKTGMKWGLTRQMEVERFIGRRRIEVVVKNLGIAQAPVAWVRTNLAGDDSVHLFGQNATHKFIFDAGIDGALDWVVWITIVGADNTTFEYNIYYDIITN